MTDETISRPSRTSAAAVSSQELSMPRTNMRVKPSDRLLERVFLRDSVYQPRRATRELTTLPADAVARVFERDAERGELVAYLVGAREVAAVPRLLALVSEAL